MLTRGVRKYSPCPVYTIARVYDINMPCRVGLVGHSPVLKFSQPCSRDPANPDRTYMTRQLTVMILTSSLQLEGQTTLPIKRVQKLPCSGRTIYYYCFTSRTGSKYIQ